MSAKEALCSPSWIIQVSRKIGISVVASFLLWVISMTWGFAWYASRLDARVAALEVENAEHAHVMEDLREIRTDLRWIKQYIQRGQQ